jgi:hypothetical protein
MKSKSIILLLVSQISIAGEVTFDADGNIVYDSSSRANKPCEEVYPKHTCRSMGVLNGLSDSTAEYQGGFYARKEALEVQKKEDARRAIAREQERRQKWEDNLREREVRAMERNSARQPIIIIGR